jgi:hypothetical protein
VEKEPSLAKTVARTGCVIAGVYLAPYILPIIGFVVLIVSFGVVFEVNKVLRRGHESELWEAHRISEEIAWVNALLGPSLPSLRSHGDTNWSWMVSRVHQVQDDRDEAQDDQDAVRDVTHKWWEAVLLAREDVLKGIETSATRAKYQQQLIAGWERTNPKYGHEESERTRSLFARIDQQLAQQGIERLDTDTLREYLLSQGLPQEEVDFLLYVR